MSLKFCYTFGDNFCVLTSPLKEEVEQSLGYELTEEQFYNYTKSFIPEGATGVREISAEEHIAAANSYRKYREAWCDVSEDEKINVDMTKAKECALTRLRDMRQESFVDLGFPNKLNPDLEEAVIPLETRTKLQELRDVTEPLKAIDTAGKYDDDALLAQFDQLSDKQVLDAIVEGANG